MAHVHTQILIKAPISECFDLARDITIHSRTVWSHTKEKTAKAAEAGMIGQGETVTFEATHFGIRQRLTVRIDEYARPYRFSGVMLKGVFRHFRHTHEFKESGSGTIMTDIMDFASPLGIIGRWFDALILERYMKAFITYRQNQLKMLAEGRTIQSIGE